MNANTTRKYKKGGSRDIQFGGEYKDITCMSWNAIKKSRLQVELKLSRKVKCNKKVSIGTTVAKGSLRTL